MCVRMCYVCGRVWAVDEFFLRYFDSAYWRNVALVEVVVVCVYICAWLERLFMCVRMFMCVHMCYKCVRMCYVCARVRCGHGVYMYICVCMCMCVRVCAIIT